MAKAKQVKTREQVTNIQQPTVERIGEAVMTVGKVTIRLRALTFWERKYIETLRMFAQGMKYDEEGKVIERGDPVEGLIAQARMVVRIGIEAVEGMPVETVKMKIAGRELDLLTEETLAMLPDEVIEQAAETVQILSSLTADERVKLDFFSQSVEETGPTVTESVAAAAPLP